jgi:hypothetical protein
MECCSPGFTGRGARNSIRRAARRPSGRWRQSLSASRRRSAESGTVDRAKDTPAYTASQLQPDITRRHHQGVSAGRTAEGVSAGRTAEGVRCRQHCAASHQHSFGERRPAERTKHPLARSPCRSPSCNVRRHRPDEAGLARDRQHRFAAGQPCFGGRRGAERVKNTPDRTFSRCSPGDALGCRSCKAGASRSAGGCPRARQPRRPNSQRVTGGACTAARTGDAETRRTSAVILFGGGPVNGAPAAARPSAGCNAAF